MAKAAKASNTLAQKLAVEALGTFLLVFLGAGAIVASASAYGAPDLLIVAIGLGMALAIGVTIAMSISGGHINPAVTIGMLVTGRIKAADAAAYIVAQVVGGYIGAALLALILPASVGAAVNWGSTTLSANVSVLQGIAIEAVITFILVLAVFGTAVDERAPRMGGLGIGLALMLCVLVAGPFTGGSANPARTIGPELVSGNFSYWYVYWIGPIIGGIVAALMYQNVILRKR
jgi:MIP family channel proteins